MGDEKLTQEHKAMAPARAEPRLPDLESTESLINYCVIKLWKLA